MLGNPSLFPERLAVLNRSKSIHFVVLYFARTSLVINYVTKVAVFRGLNYDIYHLEALFVVSYSLNDGNSGIGGCF